MTPTIKIVVLTDEGEAIITSNMPWNTIGDYEVTGDGEELAREWIENQHGAFGNFVGKVAAPCDLHRAAVMQQNNDRPEDEIVVESIEGDIQEYSHSLEEGQIT